MPYTGTRTWFGGDDVVIGSAGAERLWLRQLTHSEVCAVDSVVIARDVASRRAKAHQGSGSIREQEPALYLIAEHAAEKRHEGQRLQPIAAPLYQTAFLELERDLVAPQSDAAGECDAQLLEVCRECKTVFQGRVLNLGVSKEPIASFDVAGVIDLYGHDGTCVASPGCIEIACAFKRYGAPYIACAEVHDADRVIGLRQPEFGHVCPGYQFEPVGVESACHSLNLAIGLHVAVGGYLHGLTIDGRDGHAFATGCIAEDRHCNHWQERPKH